MNHEALRARSIQTTWARCFIDSLVGAGVTRFVLSPGSRNTPLLFAVHAHRGVTTATVVDERAAAFFALGQIRLTAEPVALICTSGSAGAHYLPGIVEAFHAGLPLLAITADRPGYLQACGAPQTVDQTRLYGTFVRWFADIGHPSDSAIALRALARACRQAVELCRTPEPGPVHLNFPAVKPLEPNELLPSEPAARSALASSAGTPAPRRGSRASLLVETKIEPPALTDLAELVTETARGVITCGPCRPGDSVPLAELIRLSTSTGYPIYAEASSQATCSDGAHSLAEGAVLPLFDLFVRQPEWRAQAQPDLVLQLGSPPTSGAWAQWMMTTHAQLHVVAPTGWPDPHGQARRILRARPSEFVRALNAALSDVPRAQDWRALHAGFQTRARQVVEEYLGLHPDAEGAAVACVMKQLPAGANLVLGNSLALRDADWFGGPVAEGCRIFTQRGANGIDGLIAGALGVAHAGTGEPTLAILGDVSALHDIGALQLASLVRTPVVLVVLNNGGGRIFDHLPLGSLLDEDGMGPWRTPHELSVCAIAQGFSLRAVQARGAKAIGTIVQEALGRAEVSVVEAMVAPDPPAWFESWNSTSGPERFR